MTYTKQGHLIPVNNYQAWSIFSQWGMYDAVNDNRMIVGVRR